MSELYEVVQYAGNILPRLYDFPNFFPLNWAAESFPPCYALPLVQVSVDYGRFHIHQDQGSTRQGRSQGSGGDVPWSTASHSRTLPSQLPF